MRMHRSYGPRRTAGITGSVLLTVLLLLPVMSTAAPQSGGQITLEQAVDLALQNNPQVAAARQQVRGAQGAVVGASGRLLPTLSFSGSWNFAEKVQTIANPFASLGGPPTLTIDFTQDYQGSVALNYPLWTWGANSASYHEANAGLDAARQNAESAEAQVSLQVTQAFYGVILASRGVEVSRDALTQAERQEEIAAQRVAQGAASEFEHLRAQVQAANLRPAVARAEAGLRQARIGLNLLLGRAPDTPMEVVGELAYEPVDLDVEALKNEAVANRPEVQSARLGTQRAELAVKMARASRLPTLLVNGTFGFRADNAALSSGYNDNYAGNLIVSIPLFDGFAARSRTQQADAGRAQSRILLEQTQRSVRAEVESAWYDLKAAEESYLAQQDNVRQAQRAIEIAQVSFENGMITGVELMDSQLALTVARQNQDQALYDYQVALARIERAVGRPLQP